MARTPISSFPTFAASVYRVVGYRFLTSAQRTKIYLKHLQALDFISASDALEIGVDPLYIDRNTSQSAFIAAIKLAPLAHLRIWLAQGAMLRSHDKYEVHPLWAARSAATDRAARIKLLIQAGANVNGVISRSETSLLNGAVWEEDIEFLQTLLENKAEIDRPDPNGITALQMAAIIGKNSVIDLLRRYGSSSELPSLSQIEQNFITIHSFRSQIHEAIKNALRFSECPLIKLRIGSPDAPGSEDVFQYHFILNDQSRILELKFLPQDRIQLVLLAQDSYHAVFDFLQELPQGQLNIRELKTTVHTALKAIRSGNLSDGTGSKNSQKSSENENEPIIPLTPKIIRAYQILGLDPGAPSDKAVNAYRRLAKRYHPDLHHANTADEELKDKTRKMSEINAAYELLEKSAQRK